MIDIVEVKRRLVDAVEAVARDLLPGGTKEGGYFVAGSVGGEAGRSLKVYLSGPKAGRWCDYATGEDSGDLLDLWCKARGVSLPEALRQAKGWLGIREPEFQGSRKPAYKRPERPKCTAPKSAVREYLVDIRGISEDAIAAYRVGENGRDIVFPHLIDDELVHVKFKTIDKIDGKRKCWASAGTEPCLFGWQAIGVDARQVTITEGEEDALTMFGYGFPALSVPFGGGGGSKQQWIESDYERLERFETIYLALDQDGEGRAATAEIAKRLGLHRCRIVQLPYKDANDCLMEGITPEDMAQVFAAARTMDPEELRSATDFYEAVCKLFFPSGDEPEGYTLFCVDGPRLRFRQGELTVWTGATGHGKSQCISHAVADWMSQGARVCIASLEMAPQMLLARLAKQICATGDPTEDFLREAFDWMDGKAWIFNLVGKSGYDRLLEVFDYARRRYGVDTFVIDSFMRVGGIAPDDYAAQERAVFAITSFAVDNGVHVHLVCHSTKDGAQGVQENEDVKGTGEIIANAFNIIAIWRNKKHENELAELMLRERAGENLADIIHEKRQKPSVVLKVGKQRNGDWEGRVGLHFCTKSYQYRRRFNDTPEPYIRRRQAA